jgi:hypothetical protein
VDGNLQALEHNNEMSTWEALVHNLPIDFVFMFTFCGTIARACRYLSPGARTQKM